MNITFTTYFQSGEDTPLINPTDAPVIKIRRLDTNAVTDDNVAMSEVGDGIFKFDKTDAIPEIDYAVIMNGDPNNTGQVPAGQKIVSSATNFNVGDIHDAMYKPRSWDRVQRKLRIYDDNSKADVLREFDTNSDLSEILPVES